MRYLSFFYTSHLVICSAILWPSSYLQQISAANNFEYSAINEKNMGKTTGIVGSTHNKRDFLATISKDALVNFLASISPTHIVHWSKKSRAASQDLFTISPLAARTSTLPYFSPKKKYTTTKKLLIKPKVSFN